jgi:hypothetical protein
MAVCRAGSATDERLTEVAGHPDPRPQISGVESPPMEPTIPKIDRRVHRRSTVTSRPGPAPSAAQGAYRHLRMLGLDPAEAGNLAAFVRGIAPVEQGWTVQEIDHLLFLGYLVEQGRVAS